MPRDGFPSSIVNPVGLLEVLPSSSVDDVRKDVSMEGIRDLPMITFLFVVASKLLRIGTLLCSRSLLPQILQLDRSGISKQESSRCTKG